MLKIITNTNLDLTQLANSHFDELNPKYKSKAKNNQFQRTGSIIGKIENAILNYQTNIEKTFFEYLLGVNYARIKTILTGSPLELQTIVEDFNLIFPSDLFNKFNPSLKKYEETEIGKKTKEIFNYSNYRNLPFCTEQLTKLGFKSRIPCPYCNYDELSIIENLNSKSNTIKEQALLDLDHFIPKSVYPFLALSFFNLIPTCHNCNSRFKLDKLFNLNTHINPFDKSFEDTFQFSLSNPFYLGMDIADFNFKFSNKPAITFPTDTITDLHLIERYNTDKKLIYEKVGLIVKYSKQKEKEINDLFNSQINEDIYKLAEIPINKNDIVKYKLGKLKRDICIDSGLIMP